MCGKFKFSFLELSGNEKKFFFFNLQLVESVAVEPMDMKGQLY